MDLVAQLRRDEGVRLKPYHCTAGKLTIGVGRNLDDRGITQTEADYLLANDIAEVTAQLLEQLPWAARLDEARRGALLNMAFNLGIAGLLGFKNTLKLIEAGKYEAAEMNMLRSKWATQVGPRATRLALQIRTGHWQ